MILIIESILIDNIENKWFKYDNQERQQRRRHLKNPKSAEQYEQYTPTMIILPAEGWGALELGLWITTMGIPLSNSKGNFITWRLCCYFVWKALI